MGPSGAKGGRGWGLLGMGVTLGELRVWGWGGNKGTWGWTWTQGSAQGLGTGCSVGEEHRGEGAGQRFGVLERSLGFWVGTGLGYPVQSEG